MVARLNPRLTNTPDTLVGPTEETPLPYHQHFSTRSTPQTQPIPGKPQVANSAGGYSFKIDDWASLRRFLTIGTTGGTYYIGERELTVANCEAVQRCIAADGLRVVRELAEISDAGRAPKNEPALFALAMCTAAADVNTRRAAWNVLPTVARTGTHLFTFAQYREAFGGWGRLARNGVARWYTSREPDQIAYQALKYQSRNGWSHRDILRLCHATGTPGQNAVFSAITHPDLRHELSLPRLFEGVQKVFAATSPVEAAALVADYRLTREMVPTELLARPEIWEAMLPHMGLTAAMRNLGNMTRIGLVKPLSAAALAVASRFRDADAIRKARLHPLSVLTALKTYVQGRGMRGSGTWTPVPQVTEALDDALRLSFDVAEPTGKRYVYGVDVSGSMRWSATGMDFVSCAEAAAALALLCAKTEPAYFIGGFADCFRDLSVTARDTFADACRKTQLANFGRTDCAVPMLHAIENGIETDAFVVLTDSETYANPLIHPCQAVERYRQKTGIPARMIVASMTANPFTIADPADPLSLDVVGMDSTVPSVIAEFVRSGP